MQIQEISRSYGKTINTANYGAPESWVRIDATYKGVIESTDDTIEASKALHDMAKADVIQGVNEVINAIKKAKAAQQAAMTGGNSSPAPVAPTVPSATAAPAGTSTGTQTAEPRRL